MESYRGYLGWMVDSMVRGEVERVFDGLLEEGAMRKIQRFAFLLTSFFTLSGMAVPGWADHPVTDFGFARESEMLLQTGRRLRTLTGGRFAGFREPQTSFEREGRDGNHDIVTEGQNAPGYREALQSRISRVKAGVKEIGFASGYELASDAGRQLKSVSMEFLSCSQPKPGRLDNRWQLVGDKDYHTNAHVHTDFGGWAQLGFHTPKLSTRTHRFDQLHGVPQLDQFWLYLDKGIEIDNGFFINGHVDCLAFGTDAGQLQSSPVVFNSQSDGGFTNFFPRDQFDASWDFGDSYGAAIPQLYLEMGGRNVSIKAGRMFTRTGIESVEAPCNFFYSRSLAFDRQPLSATAYLLNFTGLDKVECSIGYSHGFDTAFVERGDTWLGSMSYSPTDALSLRYTTLMGNDGGFNLQNHCLSSCVLLSPRKTLACEAWFWSQTDRFSEPGFRNSTLSAGVCGYFIEEINCNNSLGLRVEWAQVKDGNWGVGKNHGAR